MLSHKCGCHWQQLPIPNYPCFIHVMALTDPTVRKASLIFIPPPPQPLDDYVSDLVVTPKQDKGLIRLLILSETEFPNLYTQKPIFL